jgi:hypothetical protein
MLDYGMSGSNLCLVGPALSRVRIKEVMNSENRRELVGLSDDVGWQVLQELVQ